MNDESVPTLPRGLKLDLQTGEVRRGREVHRLFPQELALFKLFLARPGRVLSGTFLRESLWGPAPTVTPNALEVLVCNLRRRLGPPWSERLKTYRGLGYRWSPDGRA
jgi:DNA-binding response OmpR family regulator